MLTNLFDFKLPKGLIALRPIEPRDGARLLVVRPDGHIEHRIFRDFPSFLKKDDALSFNDSAVIAARLFGVRSPRPVESSTQVDIEVLLHQRLGPDRYRTFLKPGKRVRVGDKLHFSDGLQAAVLSRDQALADLRFNRSGMELDAAINAVGVIPLPPYIAKRRDADARDLHDYQTIYARAPGSVAAPTAGLHFSEAVLSQLRARHVALAHLTLHVGAGTFLPVTAHDTSGHRMHGERAILTADSAAVLNKARGQGGRLFAAGTTALRTLETAAGTDGILHSFDGETDIFITPGYRFRATDALLTNFHLPQSTLFMLVCAFMGLEIMQAAYAEAIRQRYRFYSYGDACLLLRAA